MFPASASAFPTFGIGLSFITSQISPRLPFHDSLSATLDLASPRGCADFSNRSIENGGMNYPATSRRRRAPDRDARHHDFDSVIDHSGKSSATSRPASCAKRRLQQPPMGEHIKPPVPLEGPARRTTETVHQLLLETRMHMASMPAMGQQSCSWRRRPKCDVLACRCMYLSELSVQQPYESLQPSEHQPAHPAVCAISGPLVVLRVEGFWARCFHDSVYSTSIRSVLFRLIDQR